MNETGLSPDDLGCTKPTTTILELSGSAIPAIEAIRKPCNVYFAHSDAYGAKKIEKTRHNQVRAK